ncbi:MAG: hypothetical protein K0Q51_1235 [Rickettsiaceae bacterium]|jgi:Ran GTPase-activating protein (RanGAP) involved in mRNA processing and transport|nr:hypothetical protein [Rickettsiaceae bacterium]
MRLVLLPENFEQQINYIGDLNEIVGIYLEQEHTDKLFELLKNHKDINKLDLSNCAISEEALRNFSENFHSCSGLEHLVLAKNLINDAKVESLVKIIQNAPNLKSIDFSNNIITNKGANALYEALKDFENLESLKLGFNHISHESASNLIKVVSNNKNLLELDLSGGSINDEEASVLADALSVNKVLKSLNLSLNEFTDEGITELFNALSVNKTIENLELDRNIILQSGVEAIAEFLNGNSNIKFLSLNSARLDNKAAEALAKTINSTNMMVLHIARNNISDEGVKAIAEALKENSAIVSLDLSDNNFGAEGMQALAEAIEYNGTLSHLEPPFNSIDNFIARNKMISDFIDKLCAKEALKDDFIIRDKNNEINFDPKIEKSIPILLEKKLVSATEEEIEQCIKNLRFELDLAPESYEAIIAQVPTIVDFSINEAVDNFLILKQASDQPIEIVNEIAKYLTTSGFTFWKTRKGTTEDYSADEGISEGKMEVEEELLMPPVGFAGAGNDSIIEE